MEIATLRDQASKGLTAREIADQLPLRSRNAVIGMAHRLGIAFANKPSGREVPAVKLPRKRKSERKSPMAKVQFQIPDEQIIHDPTVGKSLYDATSEDCKFIAGAPASLRICGNPTVAGKSWCQDHVLIVYSNQGH